MAGNEIAMKTKNAVNANSPISTVNEIKLDFAARSLDRGYDVDVLSQFKTNLQQVEDLNLRLRFVLNEVGGLLKRK
jgi:hypothetical protein